MSSLKSLLFDHSWMYAKRGGVAACAATPPRLVYIQLWPNNSDFSENIVTP